jgi:DNA modification methylase
MLIETVKLSEVKTNPNNPRLIKDDKFAKLVASIKSFPDMLKIRPIVVNSDMIVLGGNMRLKACKEAGLKEVPIIRADNLTEDQQREFIIKDNVGFGEWEWEMIKADWDVQELAEWGLDIPEFETTELEAVDDDYEMPDQVETDIVIGDLFEIGEHRLLCGDSTDSDAVDRLMNGEKADMAHNDPPYGMKKEKDGVLNDNLNFDDLLDFNREWIPLQFMHLKESSSWYCWGIDEPLMDIYSEILRPYFKEEKAVFRNFIKWQKSEFVQNMLAPSGRSYSPMGESCLFIMLGVQGFNNNADNYFEGWEPIRLYLDGERKKSGFTTDECNRICGKTNMTQSAFTKGGFRLILREDYEKLKQASNGKAFLKEYEEIKKEYEEIKKEWYSSRAYFDNTHEKMGDVWHFNRTSNKEREDTGNHATPKPIPLCERAIKSSCPDSGLVIDFFLGSGSTMVASHQLKRKCYGMELDPKYCQVIIDRMIKLDPSLTIKRNGEPYQVTGK